MQLLIYKKQVSQMYNIMRKIEGHSNNLQKTPPSPKTQYAPLFIFSLSPEHAFSSTCS